MPNQAPKVTVTDQTVLINASIAATDLFTVSDADDDPILKYRFEDFSADVNSGYFSLNGQSLTNGSMTEIDAVDLADMVYFGGTLIANEEFRVQAWDGTAWSGLNATAVLYTTRQQITSPVASATDFSVLANEVVAASTFVSAFDPDGYPILRYYIKDDRVDNSYFKLGDTTLAQGSFHYVSAAQFGNLHYHGFGGQSSEKIRVFAYDGSAWSSVSIANATTVRNRNAPTMEFNADIVPTRELISMDQYLSFFDADGNSIKAVRFWDTSAHDHSGHLLLNGEQLAAKQWHELSYSDIANLEYMGAEREMNEKFAVRVYDGRYWSPIEQIVLSTVFKPEISDDPYVYTRQLQVIDVPDLYEQQDLGPSLVKYEIMDVTDSGGEADISGYLSYFGSRLDVGEIYEFSTSQFNNLKFVSGPFEAREDDELYARAFNGVFWSDWTRVTVSTHSEYDTALLSGTTWMDYNWTILPEPNLVTYSFMHQFPGYQSGDATADNWMFTFNNTQRNAARRAFAAVESYCNLNFQEVADSGIQEKTGWRGGIIRMGNYTLASDTAAYAFYPSDQETGGDMWFNLLSINDQGELIGQLQYNDWSYGTGAYSVFLHELGHALGLKHPFDGNPILPPATDNDVYTVMSYTGRPDMISPSTHALYDIYSLQQLYGVNEETATGDDVYSIANTWGSQSAAWTIWDAGGNDTLSAEGSAGSAVVDLREGRISTIGFAVNNIALAMGVQMENGIGSSNSDIMFGNEGRNVIDGGAGADEIHGFGGRDILTGGADNDTFFVGVASGDDWVSENQLAGWDTVQFNDFPGFDDFTEDLSFRAADRDLVIEYTMDEGRSQGSLTIENQKWGAWRVETLRIGGTVVDLNSVYTQCTEQLQQFAVDSGSSRYGSLVVPV
ncbi:MAG: M10 family metallopeptidase C-terminal domain-containing protein [Mariniblastus sp.]|nr:M10 family metallopeptidase C-terminal domain-containing protein [Mariniblastus sp.]